MPSKISRRDWMQSSAALTAAAAAAPMALAQSPKNIVIASSNGKGACRKAMEMIQAGQDTLDAVVAGVQTVELDPTQHGVGYAGLPNEDGVVELDASVMHGPSRRCGSVAGVRMVKTPARLAQLVMTETDHIMMVGQGADQFAKDMGFKLEELLTEESRLAWLVWKKSVRDKQGHTNWSSEVETGKATAEIKRLFPDADEKTLAWAAEMAIHPITGTINCLALNSKGEMSGCTTTSGLAWKIAGRVGDSPIIGAGLYLDQDVGAAGSTGRGEENIRIAGAHTIVENMRHGMTPKEACMDALKRISRNFKDDKARLAKFDINFYALRKDGLYAGTSLWSYEDGRQKSNPVFTVNDGRESRHEDCVALYQRA